MPSQCHPSASQCHLNAISIPSQSAKFLSTLLLARASNWWCRRLDGSPLSGLGSSFAVLTRAHIRGTRREEQIPGRDLTTSAVIFLARNPLLLESSGLGSCRPAKRVGISTHRWSRWLSVQSSVCRILDYASGVYLRGR